MVFDNVLNGILGPLLNLPIIFSILIISLLMAIMVTMVYKWMTDQELMKTLKEDMKKFQKEMKELKDNPSKVMEVQKKAMETNMKYMMHSMKPTLITFIPLILIFGWMNGNLAYEPINPGESFEVKMDLVDGAQGQAMIVVNDNLELLSDKTQKVIDGEVAWKIRAKQEGSSYLGFKYNNETVTNKDGQPLIKEVKITNEQEYVEPVTEVKNNDIESIITEHDPIKPINLFGWKIGWLGTYIIFSIIFSMSLRKLLKLH